MQITFKKLLLISGISLLSGCVMDHANSFDATPHIQAFSNHVSNATQSLGESSNRIGGHVQNAMNAASNHSTMSPSNSPTKKIGFSHGSHSFSTELSAEKNNMHSNTSFSSNGYSASMGGGHHQSHDGSSQSNVSSSMSVPSMNGGSGQTTISSNAGVSESADGRLSAVAGASGSGLN